jgi:hypothetical protein
MHVNLPDRGGKVSRNTATVEPVAAVIVDEGSNVSGY